MRMFLILAIALGTYCASASNVKKENEGYADENGVFHFSGETAQDANHSALISNLVSSVGEWGLVPLGEPGNIDTNGSFRVKPDWKCFPEFEPGLRFLDADVKGPAETYYMGYPLPLTAREHSILRCLFYRAPYVTSKIDLMELCYPEGTQSLQNIVVQIRQINQKAARIDRRPLIVNVYGKGYRLRDGILR